MDTPDPSSRIGPEPPPFLTLTELLGPGEGRTGNAYIESNIIAPFTNNAILEPYNAAAGLINGVSGREVFHEQKLLTQTATQFLSSDWFLQSACSGLGMVVPYTISAKLAGGGLRAAGAKLRLEGVSAQLIKSEILAGVTGAALYDGLRNPREGESRVGNILAGATAFAVFGTGNRFCKDLTGLKAIASRSAIGFAGAEAQLTVSRLVSQGHLPSGPECMQAGVSGAFMNNVLPRVQQKAEQVILESQLSLGLSAPVDRFATVRLGAGHGKSADLSQLLHENPWARVCYGKHNDFSTASNGTVHLWTRLAAAEDLARGLHRISDAKQPATAGTNNAWQESAAQLQQGNVERAWSLFRDARATQEAQAHTRAQIVGNQLKQSEVLDPNQLRLEIGAWPAPGGVSYEYRWRQEFNQFIESQGSWRPGRKLTSERPFVTEAEAQFKPAEAEATMLEGAIRITDLLQKDHHIAVIVGGAVRDRAAGKPARDYDIGTSAEGHQIKQLLASNGYTVEKTPYPFVQIVRINGIVYEIASFSGRRTGPGLSPSVYQDSATRDLTINSMAMEPRTGAKYDFFGGQRDMDAKLIRTTQDPEVCVGANPRILLRIPRISATKYPEYALSTSLKTALTKHAQKAGELNADWVQKELRLLLAGSNPEVGLSILQSTGVARVIAPHLQAVGDYAPAKH